MIQKQSFLPNQQTFKEGLEGRQKAGSRWRMFFLAATTAGMIMLIILLMSVLNETFGLVAVKVTIDPTTLVADGNLESLSAPELSTILKDHLTKGQLQALFLQHVTGMDVDRKKLGADPIKDLLVGKQYPEAAADLTFAKLTPEDLAAILGSNVSQGDLLLAVNEQVVGFEILQNWTFLESVFNRPKIEQEMSDKAAGIGFSPTLTKDEVEKQTQGYAVAHLEFRSWLRHDLFANSNSSVPADAGIRSGVIGTLWVIAITMTVAVPLGVGAAIYLEEYARDSRFAQNRAFNTFNQLVETNIRNLAGVPSIIYGLLGLAIFARILSPLTSGQLFGMGNGTGNTILTAGLTLALLILPVIIINAQEAIRAVPSSIREASYGLGATKWQTVWNQVLPAAIPGIMTGIILSLSRAVGETAPLVVVGAAVFLSRDPNGLFQPFTTLPIQIYNWASQPKEQFHSTASAAIVVLLVILLALNAVAIIIRQRFSRRLQG